jgi:murein L,D-transpeptidase YcbB/YkuD
VSSAHPSRLALSLLALICICPLPQHAGNKAAPRQMDEYERTQRALDQYRTLAAEDDGTLLPENGVTVAPGDSYEGIPRLARLLRRLGDLSADAPQSHAYQGRLVTAVKHFQLRHGLAPSGRIDKSTLAQLNTPLEFRVHQLELALERWRRRPYDPSRPAIVLNLPEFRLRAFNAGNQQELEMKIVVGQAPDRPTPLLASQVQTVIFRPYWNVPISIQRDELVPEIMKDPSYLAANHLEVVTAQGDVVPDPVSDDEMAQLRSGTLGLRQTPGPGNVLGLVKFLFPNAYGVYMHGTSAPGLFARTRRDFSHGCVRVERAEDLAEWVLRDEAGWSRDRIRKAMRGSESVIVNLNRPIQVVTMYVTAVVLATGEVHFYEDIYEEDAAFERELAGAAPAPASHSIAPGIE